MTVSTPLIITRTFAAPLERVWQAFSEPEAVKRWWGPKDFTSPTAKIDFQIGGQYLFCMKGPDGKEYWSTGTYKEIVPLKKIVSTDSFSDSEGNIVSASEYGMEGFPLELEITLEFQELPDGKTQLKLTHVGIPEGKMGEMTSQGWNESLDKLAASL